MLTERASLAYPAPSALTVRVEQQLSRSHAETVQESTQLRSASVAAPAAAHTSAAASTSVQNSVTPHLGNHLDIKV